MRRTAALLAQLNEGAAQLDELFRGVYAHIFQSTLLMPLIGAYEILNGQVDPFLFATAPLNLIIFIPLCFAGQVSPESRWQSLTCSGKITDLLARTVSSCGIIILYAIFKSTNMRPIFTTAYKNCYIIMKKINKIVE